jgi:hypothetical protein
MSERDLDKNPYSADERRVASFFFERGTGGGDDPVGFVLASHQALADQRNALAKSLTDALAAFGDIKRLCADSEDDMLNFIGKVAEQVLEDTPRDFVGSPSKPL